MIAQVVFTLMLTAVVLVAFVQLPRIPLVGGAVISVALFGAYIVWMPDHATYLAHLVGIGRGADLVLYVWVLISCAILLLFYLQLREQLQLITALARRMALAGAARDETARPARQSTPAK
jgi:small membrane protein